jgi:hypothetical protein
MNVSRYFSGKGIWYAFFLCLMIILPLKAWAHVPLFEDQDTTGFDNALKVTKVKGSNAIYARLESPEDIDFYSVEVKEPMRFYANVIVPLSRGYEDFYPVFAVLGPGLPGPESRVPFELPEGYGAVVVRAEPVNERPTFHEPASRTDYYRGIPAFDRQVTQAGTYYIVVWHPECNSGSYVVSYGRGEKWGIRDIMGVFGAIKKVRSSDWIIGMKKPDPGFICEH